MQKMKENWFAIVSQSAQQKLNKLSTQQLSARRKQHRRWQSKLLLQLDRLQLQDPQIIYKKSL